MQEQVLEALRQLDANDDTHWTGTGDPSLELVRQVSGVSGLTRKQLTDVAPTLKRASFEEWLSSVATPDAEEEKTTKSDEPPAEQAEYTLEDYERELAELDEQVAQASRVIVEAKKAFDEVQRKRDQMVEFKHRKFPKPSPMELLKRHVTLSAAEARGEDMSKIDAALGARARQRQNRSAATE